MIEDLFSQAFLPYFAQGLYSLLLLAAGYLWRGLQKTRRDNELVKAGLCSLLRDRLIHKYEKCNAAGYCSLECLEDIESMYEVYKSLGGNGIVKKLIVAIRNMPTEPPKGETA